MGKAEASQDSYLPIFVIKLIVKTKRQKRIEREQEQATQYEKVDRYHWPAPLAPQLRSAPIDV